MAGRRGRLVRARPAQTASSGRTPATGQAAWPPPAQAARGTRGARSMLRRGRRLLRRRGRGEAKPEGALLGYLDFLMTYVQRPEETVRRHAPDARRQVSRPLVAFFLLSFTVASATYALRGRAELPEDNGTVVSGVRGLGQEMLPVAVFLSLLVLAAFLELARITLPKGFQGRAGGASWDGARATLNALLAFAAVLVPAATGAVLAAELTLARLPTAAAGASCWPPSSSPRCWSRATFRQAWRRCIPGCTAGGSWGRRPCSRSSPGC